jgi:VTC domain
VHRQAGALLLAGHLPGPEHIASDRPKHLATAQRFCHLMHQLNARPVVHVGYLREAWVSKHNNSVRVTMDRDVRGEARHSAVFDTQMLHPVRPFGRQLVLELKFTDRFPDWFNELVRHFNLMQTGAPKYCGSVAESGEEHVLRPNPLNGKLRLAHLLEFC